MRSGVRLQKSRVRTGTARSWRHGRAVKRASAATPTYGPKALPMPGLAPARSTRSALADDEVDREPLSIAADGPALQQQAGGCARHLLDRQAHRGQGRVGANGGDAVVE